MLEAYYLAILVGAVLVTLAAASSLLAFRFGAPLLLVFLSIGIIAGVDVIGIDFDNAQLAYFIGTLALAIILFDSGFGTSLQAFRQAAAPAITLATVGVLLTSGLVAIPAYYILGLSPEAGLLLGAIVGSTDAAAVFFLLRVGGITIRERVRSLLEIESGTNDPMAIFLTISLVELMASGTRLTDLGGDVLIGFVQQMGLGVIFGFAGGWLIRFLASRLPIDAGLFPVFTLTVALLIFSITGVVDGSGFLAVYVAGLYAGNSAMKGAPSLKRFQDGMTWLAQIVMFLILGLLATPSQFTAILWQATAVAAFLIFIARPIAVWICLAPFQFRRRETAFISWVGLRGAVSILLAIVPLIAGFDDARVFFNTAFIVVLASLLVQGWTLAPVARRLGLIVPPRIGPVEKIEIELPGTARHELLSYRVVDDSPVARGERIPRWARPSLVIRDGVSMRYQYAGRLRAGDRVYLFISPRYPPLLDRLFASPAPVEPDDDEFFGEFRIDPTRPARALAREYGVNLSDNDAERTISQVLTARLGGRADYGDRIVMKPIELIVRATDIDGNVTDAGVSLMPEEGRAPVPLFFNIRELVSVLKGVVGR